GSELGERLGVPVALDNDINPAALGEQWRGVARGVDDFVFLSIGTGFGAGLVLRGELHRGHHGAAGEVDYTLPGLDGAADPSAAAVSAFATALAADGRATTVARPYDVRAIFAAARAGDTLARELLADAESNGVTVRREVAVPGQNPGRELEDPAFALANVRRDLRDAADQGEYRGPNFTDAGTLAAPAQLDLEDTVCRRTGVDDVER